MAQTQPQQFSQSISPPVSSPSPGAPSPMNGGIPPPPKRQRLSPLPQSQSQSPYASPSFGTLQIPQSQPPPMNGMNMNGMAQTPAPPPPPGAMGPPSRPVEKATDAAELTDVLASSGIDVREEEAFLTSSYSAPGVQAQQPPRPPQPPPPQQQPQIPLNTSFASQASTTGTISSTPSFSEPSHYKPPTTQDSFYTEPATQPPVPFKDPNEPTREDTEAARRAQYHLQEPFLLAKVLEQRLQRRGFELGVRIPAEGLFHPVPGRPQPIEVTGPDGSSIVRTGKTILNQEGAPLVDILNLMSISCEERLRSVVDYSSTLARSRRAHSHGKVPVEWKDLADVTRSANVDAENPQTPLKRPHSAADQPAGKSLTEKYRLLMEKDVSIEEARAAKRAKRSANAILGDGPMGRAGSVDVPGSGASTPIVEKTPMLDKKSISKKEARRMMDSKASEAQQHQQSVETARLATNSMLSGRMFGAKKSYSWLNRGPATPSGFATPPRVNTATPTPGTEKAGRSGEPAPAPLKRLGSWREDQEKGAGIQVRDILFMLELDGRGTRHVQKAYSKDIKEDRLD
ncbi:uncharacterized protein ACLA_018690 [Aspergillus clavatus NRRL 1]|uniref:Transcription initiation factor TFIID subunit 4 n=1 Tax=Aspergillus clavatus (strain ATCC 1007 / CBS 513.65 / DSM 816 / NCTC 3887 / NRRL 1 / QM 1276 / 107) TaxID=344612 RepID=A1CNE4_ASPCL|nr:uncharacterized protein ACLA_018690 [Aspergillus clavatus NRRL 1]EAW07165.1 conserved hypothetical protein [Aspergillus clavatus NRRL 1]